MIKLSEHDNTYRTQDKAVIYHNDKKEIMASVPDCFRVGEADVLKLRKDFNDYWLMSSTRIDFKNNTVTHHFGSIVTEPKIYKLKEIPVCQPTYLKDLLDDESGLEFVKALIDEPKTSKQLIIEKFEALSGKKVEDIRFWTPTIIERKLKSSRAVLLYFDYGRFDVYCNGWFVNYNGFSRGVSVVSSAKQTKTKNISKVSKEKYNIYDYTKEPTVTERLLCNIANELARKK
jgi:hypothetical protein